MQEIEREVGHDVIAFVTSITEQCGPEGRYMHLGLTSSDVLDTAFAVQLVRSADLLIAAAEELRCAIREQALKHRGVPMVGRTHGIRRAYYLRLKLAGWRAEMRRNIERLQPAREAIRSVRCRSGRHLCASDAGDRSVRLRTSRLKPEPLATQVVPRDPPRRVLLPRWPSCGSIERFAVEIRHLQRTEVAEAFEPFGRNQKGSSAMPHKRNPILVENVTGLARLVRSYAGAALENVALWHERDISHSSVERVIGPDATIVLDFMLGRMTGVVRGLDVNPENMQRNLSHWRGAVFSEGILLALVRKGIARDEAYRWVQRAGMRAAAGADFRIEAESDADIRKHLKPEELAQLFNLERQLRYEDELLQRALGEE
jgi:adenylosuccinate lyase